MRHIKKKDVIRIFKQYFPYSISLITIIVLLVTLFQVNRIENDTALRLNLVGKQRTLIQKIVKDVLFHNANIQKADSIKRSLNDFEKTFNALNSGGQAVTTIQGDKSENISATSAPGIGNRFSDIHELWQPFRLHIEKYLYTKSRNSFEYITNNEKKLLHSLDSSASIMQKHSQYNNNLINNITLLIFGIIIITLLAALAQKAFFLRRAFRQMQQMENLLGICSNCKRIRTDNDNPENQDSWVSIEKYLDSEHGKSLTHGICPECICKLYPEFAQEITKK